MKYNFIRSVMRRLFLTKRLLPYIGFYVIASMIVIIIDTIHFYVEWSWFGSTYLENFLVFNAELSYKKLPGILIVIQTGVLGVISIALALVTIIAPKNNETSIVDIYYHESRVFEIIASSFALLIVLCPQVFMPISTIYSFNLKTGNFLLSIIPITWLVFNLIRISHFIMITFDFVNPDERKKIRKRFTRNFVQSGKPKNSHLPDPNRIMNELANKAASKIDRNDLVEFRIVWSEMADYHCFLFSLFMEQKEKGELTEFATDIDNKGKPFYTTWKAEYSKLFKRAAEKILIEDEFIKILAETPDYLLNNSDSISFSEEIMSEILGIIPILTHYMTRWARSRSDFNESEEKNDNTNSTILLSPNDTRKYISIIFKVAMRWRMLFSGKMNSSNWTLGSIEYSKLTDNYKWNNGKKHWYFLWQHLCVTSRIMTSAIADGDKKMALYFRRVVLWGYNKHIPKQWSETSINMRFLAPDVIDKNWIDAEQQGKLLSNSDSITPEDIYANMFINAYQDITFITSGLILDWLINKRLVSGVDREFIDNFLNKLQDKSCIFDLNLFFHIIRLIMIKFHEDVDNQHYYSRDIYIIMRDANQSAFYFDDEKQWEQITEASVIMLAMGLSSRKDYISECIQELGKGNNHIIADFIDCLKIMASKLEDSSKFILVMSFIGYEGEPVEALNALHRDIDEIIIDLERHL